MKAKDGNDKREGEMRQEKTQETAISLWVWLAAVLAGVALISGAVTPQAQAGSYTVRECSDSSGNPAAPDAQAAKNTSVYPLGASCPPVSGSNGLTIVNSAGLGTYGYSSWSFSAPAGTHFTDVDFLHNLWDNNVHVSYVALASGSNTLGLWQPTIGDWVPVNVDNTSADTLVSYLYCPSACSPSGSVRTFIKNIEFTIEDETVPRITSLGGDLLAGGTRRGTEALTYTGTDGQGGIRGATISVNGVEVARPIVSCAGWSGGGPALNFHPCPGSQSFGLNLNTENTPWVDGSNNVEVCVNDLAFAGGTALQACESRTVVVDNSCPSSGGGGTPANVIDAALKVGPAAPSSSIRTRSTQHATAVGTLGGPGAPGSTVCLYEQVDLPGDGRELVDTARVRNNGSFSLDIDPGPSRFFDVVYRYDNRIVEREELYADSQVVPLFKVVGRKSLRNGQIVRFRGGLPGPNANGRGISLQARAGKKWRTFKQVKANAKGEFNAIYRFTQTHGLARYIFRARVKRQGNYPYSPGSSRKRKVTVRG